MTPPRPRSCHRAAGGGAALLLLLAGVAAPACGGPTPTNPTPPPPPPPPTVTFVAAANPGTNAIALGLSTSTAAAFTLVLSAIDVADLYGYAVDLTFDPKIVMFDSAEAGSFLDGGGAVATQVSEGPPGTLVIGQSRVGAVPGVSGSGALLRLNFVSLAGGVSPFTTANGGAFSSTGAPLATQMFGGTATVPAQTAR